MSERQVVVVGAGQAGLGVARALAEAGVEAVVLEKGRIGETWRTQRWDSFRLNTPNWLSLLPGDGEPDSDPEGFMTHLDLVSYFERYAARSGLEVRTGEEVTAVEWRDGGPGFVVTTVQGSYPARSVVVASGILSSPKVPPFASDLPSSLVQLTTGTYRNAGQLPPGAVLVVGGGQSGAQIVEDLLEAGRTVYYSISGAGRLPRRYRGRDFMDWFLDMGVWDTRPTDVEDPRELSSPNPLTSGVGDRGHTVSYQSLHRSGVELLGRLVGVEGGKLIADNQVMEYVRGADEFSAAFKGRVDGFIEQSGITAADPEADPGDDPAGPESLDYGVVLDLEAAEVSSVIWATGFTADFSWLDVPCLDERGLPAHTEGISDVPGLYFIGFPWLSKRKSGVVLGIEEDANRIARHAADYLGS